jgi:hypothetical protein
MYTVEKLDSAAFERVLEGLPSDLYIPFEQTGIWEPMMDDDPERTHYGYFVVRDGESIVGTISADRFDRRERESIVCLTGPVFVAERTPATERALLKAFVSHVKKDPAVDPMYVRLQIEHPENIPGATPSIERGIFEREVVVPLEGTPEDLKKTFSSTTRNLINRARRSGLEVREVTEDRAAYFEQWCQPILEETAARDEFPAQPLWFFQRLLTSFPFHVRLYTAHDTTSETPEQPLGWVISNEYHGRGCYYLAASSHEAQKANAMPAVLNRMMLDLRERGNTAVGLTGISSERWPELKRLERFKLSFSKNIVVLPSLYDIPLHAVRYRQLRTLLLLRAHGPRLVREGLAAVKGGATRAKAALQR